MITSRWYDGETMEGRYEGLHNIETKMYSNVCGKIPSIKAIWGTKKYMECDR